MPENKKDGQLAEGKTKIILTHPKRKDMVLIRSKDKITAFNNERANEVEGKGKLSTFTTSVIFQYLNDLGIKTHFIQKVSDTEFEAQKCDMIPLEWITRRVATGSFLKRNPGVKEGFRFSPPKLEITFKDDAQGDPIWSKEMVIESGMSAGGVAIGKEAIELMSTVSVTVFEVLERTWSRQGCSLIDMKIEFGVNTNGEIVLADVIDSDSWRLWPAGQKALQLDKQFYRDLKEVTPEALAQLKKNFATTVDYMTKFRPEPVGRVAIILGSVSDKDHGEKIRTVLHSLRIPTHIRVCSAHKCTDRTLELIAEYEGDAVPTVFIACAGMSNGLGPVMAGNTCYPVINCPPLGDYGSQDVWSSLRLPSGIGANTVLSPGNAALSAAASLGMFDHLVWCHLRVRQSKISNELLFKDMEAKRENERADSQLDGLRDREVKRMLGQGDQANGH